MRKKRDLPVLLCLLLALVLMSGCGSARQAPLGPAPTPPPVPSSSQNLTYDASISSQITEPAEPASSVDQVFAAGLPDVEYRLEPDIREDNILGTLSEGTRVTCIEEQGEFLRVRLDSGEVGWVHGWYMDAMDPDLDNERDNRWISVRTEREDYIACAGEPVYYCLAAVLNCRAEPDAASTLLYQIRVGDEVHVLGREGDYYLVRLANSRVCYCSVNWLGNCSRFALCDRAVDLRFYIPTAEYQLLYASADNVTGQALFPAVPLLEETTAQKLLEASMLFQKDGYRLLIYDVYRPMTAQQRLFSVVQDVRFVHDPEEGPSAHQLGRAVDLTLIDLRTGRAIEMPTQIYSFTTQASRINQALWTKTAERNLDYMTRILESVGFESSQTEWWHFEYNGDGGAMDPDIDLSSLTTLPVSSYESPY